MKFLIKPIGLYLHIPFCERRCAYCSFYSAFASEEMLQNYTNSLIKSIKQWGGKINRPIDSIYLGGGTPSLLNHRLKAVIDTVKQNFEVLEEPEITLEVNPANNIENILQNAYLAGINRISIGAQSGIESELKTLGRTHTAADTKTAVEIAKKLGFSNISVDIMLGLPNSSNKTLEKSLDFLTSLEPTHISAYILKIEPNTLFFKNAKSLNLPDDDKVAEQYLFMCEYLKNKGYSHYEISNFCKKGFEGEHNLKYWNCEEYLGIGPSAHSFLNGERFFYPNDLKAFINGNSPVFDCFGGDIKEKIMLLLRLKEGFTFENKIPETILKKCLVLQKNNLLEIDNNRIFLTESGMLVSNSIITEILECF